MILAVKLNERLDRVLAHQNFSKEKRLRISRAPLLTHPNILEEALPSDLSIFFKGSPIDFPNPPFNLFRFSFEPSDEDKKTCCFGMCEISKEGIEVVVLNREKNGFCAFLKGPGPDGLKFFDQETLDPIENISVAHEDIAVTLAALCIQYMRPGVFVAKCSPDKEGKSVEWRLAREHYTLIHRKHAANSSTIAPRQVVEDEKEKPRMAGYRKAFLRTLSSPRYKQKRFQQVYVRSAWVGPKEWKDTAGQIYQIVQPGGN